jgi:hypothetical protein
LLDYIIPAYGTHNWDWKKNNKNNNYGYAYANGFVDGSGNSSKEYPKFGPYLKENTTVRYSEINWLKLF